MLEMPRPKKNVSKSYKKNHWNVTICLFDWNVKENGTKGATAILGTVDSGVARGGGTPLEVAEVAGSARVGRGDHPSDPDALGDTRGKTVSTDSENHNEPKIRPRRMKVCGQREEDRIHHWGTLTRTRG